MTQIFTDSFNSIINHPDGINLLICVLCGAKKKFHKEKISVELCVTLWLIKNYILQETR